LHCVFVFSWVFFHARMRLYHRCIFAASMNVLLATITSLKALWHPEAVIASVVLQTCFHKACIQNIPS